VRGGPRRAWFTLRLLGETLIRRPSVFKEAVSFAVVHQAFADYMAELGSDLDEVIGELRDTHAALDGCGPAEANP
jgi:hypothetical protein